MHENFLFTRHEKKRKEKTSHTTKHILFFFTFFFVSSPVRPSCVRASGSNAAQQSQQPAAVADGSNRPPLWKLQSHVLRFNIEHIAYRWRAFCLLSKNYCAICADIYVILARTRVQIHMTDSLYVVIYLYMKSLCKTLRENRRENSIVEQTPGPKTNEMKRLPFERRATPHRSGHILGDF